MKCLVIRCSDGICLSGSFYVSIFFSKPNFRSKHRFAPVIVPVWCSALFGVWKHVSIRNISTTLQAMDVIDLHGQDKKEGG